MSRSQLDYLRHILDEIEYLIKQTEDLTKEQFIKNSTLKRAFIRSLEIIGEATKNLSMELRERYRALREFVSKVSQTVSLSWT